MLPLSVVPLPSAFQVEPFQRAMALAATPLIEEKVPPAMSSPLNTVNAQTWGRGLPPVAGPLPIAAQPAPVQRAMRFAAAPPAEVNSPPAMIWLLNTPSASTVSLQP